MKNIIFLIIFCLFVGCKGKSSKGDTTSENSVSQAGLINGSSTKSMKLPEINFKEKYPTKKIVLQEVADIEYIPLETKADILVSGSCFRQHTSMQDSLIVTFSYQDGRIYVFNRSGKCLHTFTHLGRGAEEYVKIMNMTVDFRKKEIYIVDLYQNWRILVYGFDGTFRRVLKVPNRYQIWQLFDYDENSLLCYDGYILEGFNEEGYSTQPYALFSKTDGKITPLDLTLSERVPSAVFSADMPPFYLGVTPLIKFGDRFLLSDLACDTIYSLRDRTLTPYLLKTPPSLWKEKIPKLVRVKLATDKFTIFEHIEARVNNVRGRQAALPLVNLLYDHTTGEIVKPLFINVDYNPGVTTDFSSYRSSFPANYFCLPLSASRLLQDYEAGKLQGRLKEIASQLDEDANPVLMLVKFKK